MIKSDGFAPKWVLDKAENWTEGSRLDFKRGLYGHLKEHKRFEFAKDLIALANVARRIDDLCWIFFGVEDKERPLVDIRDTIFEEYTRPHWNNPQVPLVRKLEDIEDDLHQDAQHLIAPVPPEFHLEYGEVNDKFVAFLVVEPRPEDPPFCLRQYGEDTKGRRFKKGTAFIRRGSSSVPVAEAEKRFLLSASEADYLRREHWQSLISSCKEGYFYECQHLSPQFEPKTENSTATAFASVLNALDTNKKVTLIKGHAGTGKTVLLHRVAYRLADQHLESVTERIYWGQSAKPDNDYIEQNLASLEVATSRIVPVLCSLRGLSLSKVDDFNQILLAHIREKSGKQSIRSLETLWNIRGSSWVILLDGADELGKPREVADSVLSTWVKTLPPNVQVVITSRLDVSQGSVDEMVALATLTVQEVLDLLERHFARLGLTVDKAGDVKKLVLANPDVVKLVSRLRAMDGLVSTCSAPTRQNEFIDFALPRSPNDIPVVEATHPDSITSTPKDLQDAAGDIPIAKVNEGDGSHLSQEVENEKDDDLADVVAPLSLAQLLIGIISEMEEQEKRRRSNFANMGRFAEDAHVALQRIAWGCEWNNNSFDMVDCEEKGWWNSDTRYWNEDIGFVYRTKQRFYAFVVPILQWFLAAEFAYDDEKDILRQKLEQRDLNRQSTKSVVYLVDELRGLYGRDKLFS
ncbi:MAG: NACHT domain-containing protein [Chloroflexi bacterium]|nr:NACHT domain-containing protein [Chloroflexota bacterium]